MEEVPGDKFDESCIQRAARHLRCSRVVDAEGDVALSQSGL